MQNFEEFINKTFTPGQKNATTYFINLFKNRDIEDIQRRIGVIRDKFTLSPKQAVLLIRKAPLLLDMDVDSHKLDSLDSRINFYCTYLDLTKRQLYSIVKESPTFITQDIQSESKDGPLARIDYLRTKLQASNKEVGKMLVARPQLMTLDFLSGTPNSIMDKTEKMFEVGLTRDVIKNNAAIYAVPKNSLKLRVMLQRLAHPTGDIFNCYYPAGLTCGEQLAYARVRHLQEHHVNLRSIPANEIYRTYLFRIDTFKLGQEELLKRYPLTKQKALQLADQYNATKALKLHFAEEEIAHLPDSEAETE